jgi:hypothetical protein
MKTSASDADKWKTGDKICLIISPCDPPTLDLNRAIDLAFAKSFKSVWVCPLFVDDEQARRVSACCQVFCTEYYSATHHQIGYCSVALDKKSTTPTVLLEWFSKRFPFIKIKTCMLASEKGAYEPDVVVTFCGQESFKAKEIWPASKFLQSPVDMAERIRSGKDESRWFPSGLWEFLTEKALYRNK